MAEEINMTDVVNEVKNASEDELKSVIESWYESTRLDGMHWGAYMISAAVMVAIEKNLKKGSQSSLRDYQRAIKRIIEIISVQLTQQNDYETEEVTEEETNDGTAE